MTYSAINIGPIIATLGMARKPRELWAASYMFSYLMKCIIETLPKEKIISPATFERDEKKGIGLYPDRVFVKDYEVSYQDMITPVVNQVAKDLSIDGQYFNVMAVSGDFDQDSDAIKDLNAKLNNLELFNIGCDGSLSDIVRKLIKNAKPLFLDALGEKKLQIESLGEIAAIELQKLTMEEDWNSFVSCIRSDKQEEASKAYSYLPKEKLKSYHKYICIVQADGDNMGKAVSHSKLSDGKVKEISEALLKFGENAKTVIEKYGGFPIYAGGDDLLFIAPVVGKDYTNIFQLLKKLNNESFGEVKRIVDECKLQTADAEKVPNPVAPVQKNTGYVVFDLETTGLSPFKDEIIEIGAVKVDKEGQIVDTFTTLVKPARPVSEFIRNLTGISNEMLADAPSIYTALPRFNDFVGDAMVIGHNVTFDIAFVQQKAKIYQDIKFLGNYKYLDIHLE